MAFTTISEQFEQSDVFVGPSVNLEFTIKPKEDLPSGNFRRGKKNLVQRVDHFFAPDGGCQFQVRLLNGDVVEIPAAEGPTENPAGSSVNVAMALRRWGKNVGVFAPTGPGGGGATIRLSLEKAGVNLALFNGMRSTPRTLTVRDGGRGSTLFMVKPPYQLDDNVLNQLSAVKPQLLVGTAVKPNDLPLMLPLFKAKKPWHFRVLTPSPDLICHPELREELLTLTMHSDILQVNEEEGLALLGKSRGSFTTYHLEELQMVTQASMVVVTLSRRGALLYDSSDGEVHSQECHEPFELDSSGAGDAHLSALVWAMFLRDEGPLLCNQALKLAGWVAGQKCRHVGPWSGLPSLPEMENFLSTL